ncbi:phosphoribosyl-ATP pyrophosphatase [Sorangium cellulosum]|uniref:Histidine biosynthesis bifunctional protein HisIE n=1 Tax=Sorangium cellulosum TaxID=56 RepID=A0A2L0EJ12_SORCE|nr:bifunctional phosphoribosyl-AMP cyclohydrolase/phosphoribosyl-ATP diphosphatase HisIE [Sorangium cellulosum]AUX39286.1 phosphoribosyl-ATP pyrophosphatase [Sorangium cellulosum]
MKIAFGEGKLIPAVVQDRLTGQVRMLAYMTRESLARTLETGRATFFSRSRGELWEKGATSGNTLAVTSVHADCDADALLVLADPVGPTCHTGSPSCFFRQIEARGDGEPEAADEGQDAAAVLEALEREIEERKASTAAKSYTRKLLDGGAPLIGAKLREEAGELAQAIAGEGDDRVAAEAADVIYHLLVGVASRGVPLRAVLSALASRMGTSGLVEKARRAQGPKTEAP